MAQPTRAQIFTGEYSLHGGPWVNVTTKGTTSPDTLEYSLDGSPWWGVTGIGEKRVGETAASSIKKIGGIPIADIKKIGSITLD